MPAGLYEAIALVLVFVKRLDRRFSTGRPLELPKTSSVADDYLAGISGRRHRVA